MARRGQGGFTLLEVLVALTLLSISLAAIYEAFGTGLRNDRQSVLYREALALAEARLAQVGTEWPARPGRYEGESGGYRWSLHMVRAADEPFRETALPEGVSSLRLVEVTVEVSWGGGRDRRRVSLASLRLGARGQGDVQ